MEGKTVLHTAAVLLALLAAPASARPEDPPIEPILEPGRMFLDGASAGGSILPAFAAEPQGARYQSLGDPSDNSFDQLLGRFNISTALYAGLSAARLQWADHRIRFKTGEFHLDDGTGVQGTVGLRVNRYFTLQIDGSWFPELYEEETTGPRAGQGTHDGGSFGLSLLVHYPLWRFLPYAGGGGGMMELPEESGTELRPTAYVQGGVLFFLMDNFALSADFKYHWGFLQGAEEDVLGSYLYSIGFQLVLPLGD